MFSNLFLSRFFSFLGKNVSHCTSIDRCDPNVLIPISRPLIRSGTEASEEGSLRAGHNTPLTCAACNLASVRTDLDSLQISINFYLFFKSIKTTNFL